MHKRHVEVVVVSDLHLGTYASRAKEFTAYLKGIQPRLLILNGDIIDGWQFSKRYFPAAHIEAINEIFTKLSGGTRVIYITGNHDDILRRYADVELGNLQLVDKIAIEINDRRVWIFHGDVFDHTTTGLGKFVARLGSNGYAVLLGFNKLINFISKIFTKENISLSKRMMEQFNKRFLKVDAFEQKIAQIAGEKKFDTVICGHIHQPSIRVIETENGSVTYLNSGDWVEHATALEYYDNEWHLHHYDEKEIKLEKKSRSKSSPQVLTDEIAFYLHTLSQKI